MRPGASTVPAARPDWAKSGSRRVLFDLYRRLFSDQPERSRLLRVLTLGASAWAAVTLAYITGLAWPLAAPPCLTVAHLVCYRTLRRRAPLLSVAVAMVIIAAGVAMRYDLVLAIRGDRVPVALFLLIASCAAAFEARTRAGLYTQLIFSALVMFFASELAFGNEFALFLGAYMALVIAFLGAAHIADLTRGSRVIGFETNVLNIAYWTAAGLALAVAAGIAFLVLPWDTSQTPQAAQVAILPFNGAEEGVQPGATPAEARSLMAQPPAAPATRGSNQTGLPEADTREGAGAAQTVPSGDVAGAGSAAESGQAVAFVRSPVASYWRVNPYDTYLPQPDGTGVWVSTIAERRQFRHVLSSGSPTEGQQTNRYLQTYFLQQDIDAPLTGYNPVAWALPRDEAGRLSLKRGATYQVVSEQPGLSADALRQDRTRWLRNEYAALPRNSGDIQSLTAAVVAGAQTDFDRAATIAAYLRGLQYGVEAGSPLVPGAELREFLAGEKPGTAMDFATAAALMARSAGLQSRVVAGYLPGEFSPYSGASTVSGKDAHVWAEVYFEDAGWVPFDASPRPGIPSAAAMAKAPPRGFAYLLERRAGDSLARAALKVPSGVKPAIQALINQWPLFAAGTGTVAVSAAIAWWRLFRRSGCNAKRRRFAYSAVDNPQRRDVIRAFAKVERALARQGFRRRLKTESYGQYAAAATESGFGGDMDLPGLAWSASRASYSEMPLSWWRREGRWVHPELSARSIVAPREGARRLRQAA